jgi:hypothetical protein
MTRYDDCHTSVNSLNRLIKDDPYYVETSMRNEDGEHEWESTIYNEDGDVINKSLWKKSLSSALTDAVETLGVIV